MATNDKIFLETSELSETANSLKTKSNKIKDDFTNNCYSALKSCEGCLQVTGLDTSIFFEKFVKLFDNINTMCNELSDYLNNNLVPSYEKLSGSITNSFNSNFAEKMSSLLGISAASVVTGAKTLDASNDDTSLQKQESIQGKKDETQDTEVKNTNNDSNSNNRNYNHSTEKNSSSNEEFNDQGEVQTTNNGLNSENSSELVDVQETLAIQETPAIEETPIVEEEIAPIEEVVPADNNSNLSSSAGLSNGFKIGAGVAGVGVAAGAAGLITHKVSENNEKEEERKKKLDEIKNKLASDDTPNVNLN